MKKIYFALSTVVLTVAAFVPGHFVKHANPVITTAYYKSPTLGWMTLFSHAEFSYLTTQPMGPYAEISFSGGLYILYASKSTTHPLFSLTY